MKRIRFLKAKQREFFDYIIRRLDVLSLNGLLQFGLRTNYSSLKNYYSERRCLSEELFSDLCYLAKIDKSQFSYEVLDENWGRVKGGKIGKRGKNDP